MVGQHGDAPSPQQGEVGGRVGHADQHLLRRGGNSDGECEKERKQSFHVGRSVNE